MAQDLQSACKISRADIEALQLDSLTTHEVDLLRSYLQVLLLQQVKEEIVEGIPEEEVTRANSYDDLWKYRPDFHDVVRHIKAELLSDLGANPSEYLKAASRTRPPQSARRNKAAHFSPTESINMSGQDDQVLYEVPAIDPGTVIRDRYMVIGPAGAGGMSTIYLAEDMHLDGRKVAIKMIRENLVQNPAMLKHFNAQVKALVKLDDNPHVVNIEDRDSYFGIPFVVMEYVDGFSLRELLSQNGSLSNMVAANYAKQVAEGLAFVHGNNILHLDVKPANVLIKKSTDTALLSDFDISWNPDWGVSIGGAGTPAYMPPEQFESHDLRDYGAETDIYALGATLYHMVTGQPPYGDRNSSNYLNMGFRKPHDLNSSVDSQLESIILHCMQWNKADRYHSASDLAEDLASYLNAANRVKALANEAPQESKDTPNQAAKVNLKEEERKQREEDEEPKERHEKIQYNESKTNSEKKHRNHKPIVAFIAVVAVLLVAYFLGRHLYTGSMQDNGSSSHNGTIEESSTEKTTIEGAEFTLFNNTYYTFYENNLNKIENTDSLSINNVYQSAYGNIISIMSIDNVIYYLCQDDQNNTLSLCEMEQGTDRVYESLIKCVQVDNLVDQSVLNLYWYDGLFYIVYYPTYKEDSDNSSRKIIVNIVDTQNTTDESESIKAVTPLYFSKNHCVYFSARTIFYSDDLGNIRYHPIDDASKAGFIREEDYRAKDDASKRSEWDNCENVIITAVNDGPDSFTVLACSPITWGLSLLTGKAASGNGQWASNTIIGSTYDSLYLEEYYYSIYTIYDAEKQRIYFTVGLSQDDKHDSEEVAVLSCKLDGSDLQQCASANISTNSFAEPVFAENGRVLICLTNSGDQHDSEYIEMNPDGTNQKVILQETSQ